MPLPGMRPMTQSESINALWKLVHQLAGQVGGGGFDPNEDPVIIGSGAAGAAGSTPTAPNSGDTGSVILGLNATVDSRTTYYGDVVAIGHGVLMGGISLDVSRSVAIGYGATMTDQHSQAIGDGASVAAYNAVALGSASSVGSSAHDSIAIGRQASVTAHDAVAIGHLATSAYANSAAIGQGSATDRTGQIMLGKNTQVVDIPNKLAMYDTNDGLRYEAVLTSGAFVWTQVS